MKEDNVLEGIVRSVKFMLQQYLLACFYLSFFRNWLSIVLLMLNIQIINDFHNKLVELVDKKSMVYVIELLCVVLVGLTLVKFGYYSVSNVLTKLPI